MSPVVLDANRALLNGQDYLHKSPAVADFVDSALLNEVLQGKGLAPVAGE